MAEKKTAKAAKPKAKKAKAALPKKPARTAVAKTRLAAQPKKAARRLPRPAKPATINIAELFDHPLVADLLAVGALAAVAAIAEHNINKRTGKGEAGSGKAIKAAGKAAAAAVGKRLMTEVDAIKQASKPKEKRRGSK